MVKRPQPSAKGWEFLHLIAEGVVDAADFSFAVIRVVRGDDHLEVVAIAGDDGAREQIGTRTPTATLIAELERAEHWGALRFVAHQRHDTEGNPAGSAVHAMPQDADDKWHPRDLLIVPLLAEDGALLGTLTMTRSADRRRPSPRHRSILERYAQKATRALQTALETEQLAEQVRLADAARRIVRHASGQRSLQHLLETSQAALLEGFQALGMWIHIFDDDGPGTGSIYSADGKDIVLTPTVSSIATDAAHLLWEEQQTLVVDRHHPPDLLSEAESTQVVDLLHSLQVGSILFLPLGAGHECLGNLVLTRADCAPDWTETEARAALEVGRDLGGAILNVRAHERQTRLVEELQQLDGYKSQLIATVSHELKTPLTTLLGHLALLDSLEDLPSPVTASLRPMAHGAQRLSRIVDDLLLLSKVGDLGTHPIPRPVDLRTIVEDVLELIAVEARNRNVTVRVEPGDVPAIAMGDSGELDLVVSNLVTNAVKYSKTGGHVVIAIGRRGDRVELSCTDDGLGLSDGDKAQIFAEFFRSSNPAAQAQPGTGLGLAIVSRIVQRHDGEIEVESELGRGSTFRVLLPAPEATP
jgi:two-component system, OmpR family, phosphate regulon sensor histidine kinase PhoR